MIMLVFLKIWNNTPSKINPSEDGGISIFIRRDSGRENNHQNEILEKM